MFLKSSTLLVLAWVSLLPVIVTGNVFYEPRLSIIDEVISANTLLYMLSVFFVLSNFKLLHKTNVVVIFALLFIIVSFVFCFFHPNSHSNEKLLDFVLFSLLGASILSMSINTEAELKIHITTIYFMLALFILAFFWKLIFGFWVRSTLYFMNGPIVFGKHMGIGLLLIISLGGDFFKRIRAILVVSFVFGVVWSMSKGPILSLLATLGFIYLVRFKPSLKVIVRLLIFSCLSSLVLFTLYEYIMASDLPIKRIITGTEVLFSGDYTNGSSGYGSVGSRLDFYTRSWELFLHDPIYGVGLGSWGDGYSDRFTYPHNYFLEILAEMGMVGILCISVPTILFLLNYKDRFYSIPLFLLISQQFSGDLSDAKWLGIYSIYVFHRYLFVKVNNVKI